MQILWAVGPGPPSHTATAACQSGQKLAAATVLTSLESHDGLSITDVKRSCGQLMSSHLPISRLDTVPVTQRAPWGQTLGPFSRIWPAHSRPAGHSTRYLLLTGLSSRGCSNWCSPTRSPLECGKDGQGQRLKILWSLGGGHSGPRLAWPVPSSVP